MEFGGHRLGHLRLAKVEGGERGVRPPGELHLVGQQLGVQDFVILPFEKISGLL